MPRVQMTKTVRVVIYVLRIYLIFLLALILWKFLKSDEPKIAPAPETKTVKSPALAAKAETPAAGKSK